MKSLDNIIESLLNATSNDKIHWEERGDGVYEVELGGYYIRVYRWANTDNDTRGITASLMNNLGKEIDSISANEYEFDMVAMKKLFDFARRNANSVNEAISDIQEELGRLL